MRIAALVLGIIGGLIGLVISVFTSGLAVGVSAVNGALGSHPEGLGNGTLGLIVLLIYAIPIAGIIGGALSIRSPLAGAVLMILSGLAFLFWLGLNLFTIVPIACSVTGGVLALFTVDGSQPEAWGTAAAERGRRNIAVGPTTPAAAHVVLAWGFVGIPLAWGVFQTVMNALKLFH